MPVKITRLGTGSSTGASGTPAATSPQTSFAGVLARTRTPLAKAGASPSGGSILEKAIHQAAHPEEAQANEAITSAMENVAQSSHIGGAASLASEEPDDDDDGDGGGGDGAA